jgi:putative ABC transport system substrate-binding protein
MRRRAFISLLGGAAAWPLAAHAQQPEKMLRVGALSAQPRAAPIWLAFERRMAELGYKHGTNFALEFVQVDSIGGLRTRLPRAGSPQSRYYARQRPGDRSEVGARSHANAANGYACD